MPIKTRKTIFFLYCSYDFPIISICFPTIMDYLCTVTRNRKPNGSIGSNRFRSCSYYSLSVNICRYYFEKLQQGKIIQAIFCFFPNLLWYFLGFWGFILFQNGKLRSPVILQYFLDDFGNFENFVKIRTRRPPNYYQMLERIQENLWNHPGKYYLCQYGTQKNRKCSKTVCPRYHVCFVRFVCEILCTCFF